MFNATFRALLCLGLLLQMTGVLNAQSGEGLLVLDAGEPRQVITAYAQDQVINFQHLKKAIYCTEYRLPQDSGRNIFS